MYTQSVHILKLKDAGLQQTFLGTFLIGISFDFKNFQSRNGEQQVIASHKFTNDNKYFHVNFKI